MSTPQETAPNQKQATESPAADGPAQDVIQAVDSSKPPASSRKRARPEGFVSIKAEEDDGFITPSAPASNTAKRLRGGDGGQAKTPGPGSPPTPTSNKSYSQTSASPGTAVGGSWNPNALPWSPSSARPAQCVGGGAYALGSGQSVGIERYPETILQSVESDDLEDNEDDVSTMGSERMQELRQRLDALRDVDPEPDHQLSARNQDREELAEGGKEAAHIDSPAPEESDADYDALRYWRREQIMLNAVLKARDEFSLLPSSWKVHFSGGPSTDRMFYRKVKNVSFRPRIYAHAEKYEITGAHHLRNMMQISSRIRDLRIAQGKVASDQMRLQAARELDKARLRQAITKKLCKLLTDALHWSRVDGGLDVFGDQLLSNVAIVEVSGSESSKAEIDDHMEKLAQRWRDRLASLGSQPSSTTTSPVAPVLYGFIIMNHMVLIATKDAAAPNSLIHVPIKINMAERLQQSWNALGLMVTVCWARDKLMETAAELKLNAQEGGKEDSDPDV